MRLGHMPGYFISNVLCVSISITTKYSRREKGYQRILYYHNAAEAFYEVVFNFPAYHDTIYIKKNLVRLQGHQKSNETLKNVLTPLLIWRQGRNTIQTPIRNESDKSFINFSLMKRSKKYFIFSAALYLIMSLMKSPNNFEKIVILKK